MPPSGKIIRIPEVPKGPGLGKPIVLDLPKIKTAGDVHGTVKVEGSAPPIMKIVPDLGKANGSPSSVFKLKMDPAPNQIEPKMSLKKRITTVSAAVTAVIAMFLGAVTVENYVRLKRRADQQENPDLAEQWGGLKMTSQTQFNGVIEMREMQTQGMVETPKGKVNIQVETLYLDYNHKAILTVTTPEPLGLESLKMGEGEFMTELTVSGVSQSQAELLHKQFSKEYQATGSAQDAFEWLRKSPWGSMIDPS